LNQFFSQAKTIVKKEINCLAGLYPYNIKKFLDKKMLHAASMLSFNSGKYFPEDGFSRKILNLAAGIELLAVGVKMHDFDAGDFIMPLKDTRQMSTGKAEVRSEKNYTPDLLFGDIFFSRAAIYILEYGDHELFDTILNSLKSVHYNKLILQQQLVNLINGNNNIADIINNSIRSKKGRLQKSYAGFEPGTKMKITELMEENETLIAGTNSLLKTSFFTGWVIFSYFDDAGLPYNLINDFILFKTLNDLEGFFDGIPVKFNFLKSTGYIAQRKKFLKYSLPQQIEGLEPAWLKSNFRYLLGLYV